MAAPTKEKRVAHIVGLMASGRWVTCVTYGELAKKWKLHPGMIRQDAAEASRTISRHVRSDRGVTDRVHVVLEKAAADLENVNRDPKALPGAKVMAIKAKADIIRSLIATDTTASSIAASTGKILRAIEKVLPPEQYEAALNAIAGISDCHEEACASAIEEEEQTGVLSRSGSGRFTRKPARETA